MKSTYNFGYSRSLGASFLTSLYTGNFGYSYVDSKGGDILNYSRRKTHKLNETPSIELLREVLFTSLVVIEYAIKDLVTIGQIKSTKGVRNSLSSKYTPKILEGELSWVFDPYVLSSDNESTQGFTFEYCCEALDLEPTIIRDWLEKRIKRALEISKEIKCGLRKPRASDSKRRGGLYKDSRGTQKEFFCNIDAL